MSETIRCKNCGKPIVRTNWYNGPGWTHAIGGPVCGHLHAHPDKPACAACDDPVEMVEGVMVHPNGNGHEVRP